MNTQEDFENESFALLPCVLAGVVVAIVLAPKDDFFVGNILFYWVPQLMVLSLTLSFTSRPAIVSGVAVILALYLAVYGGWIFLLPNKRESLSWLGYLFCMPGAAIGAVAGAWLTKKNDHQKAMLVGAIAATTTAIGLVTNQVLICSTLMHCSL